MFYLVFLVLLALNASAEPIPTTPIIPTIPSIYNSCPFGVLQTVGPYFLQLHNGTCFYFAVNRWKTYNGADADCVSGGGTLALPKTKALNDYLTDQLLNHYNRKDEAWIGLHDKDKEGRFQWEDDTSVEWTNFASGNGPDNGWFASRREDCVAIDPLDDGMWHDFQCKEDFIALISGSEPLKMYICQYN